MSGVLWPAYDSHVLSPLTERNKEMSIASPCNVFHPGEVWESSPTTWERLGVSVNSGGSTWYEAPAVLGNRLPDIQHKFNNLAAWDLAWDEGANSSSPQGVLLPLYERVQPLAHPSLAVAHFPVPPTERVGMTSAGSIHISC